MPSTGYIFVPNDGGLTTDLTQVSQTNVIDNERLAMRLEDAKLEKGISAPTLLYRNGHQDGVLVIGSRDDARRVGNIVNGDDFAPAQREVNAPAARSHLRVAFSNASAGETPARVRTARPSITGATSTYQAPYAQAA